MRVVRLPNAGKLDKRNATTLTNFAGIDSFEPLDSEEDKKAQSSGRRLCPDSPCTHRLLKEQITSIRGPASLDMSDKKVEILLCVLQIVQRT